MTMNKMRAGAVFAIAATTQTPLVSARCSAQDAEDYPFIAKEMTEVGGDFLWKSYQTVTEDDYIITLFRIQGDQNGKRVRGQGSKGPILLQHGFLSDSIVWFDRSDEDELAVGSKLFLDGYDVWYGNVRGTMYSRDHTKYDPDKDAADYWDFSLREFGLYDLPAMIKLIHGTSKTCKKVTYVGHSRGNSMGFYSLAHSQQAGKYMSQMVALSPCFIGNFDTFFEGLGINTYRLLASVFTLFGIHSALGPSWPDQRDEICFIRGESSEECQQLSRLDVGPIASAEGNEFGYKEVSIKQAMHMMQNSIVKRFQEYGDYFYLGSMFEKRKLVPLEDIQDVPIRYMYMLKDKVCDIETQRQMAERISTNDGETSIDEKHTYASGANDAEYMNQFYSLLLNSGEEMTEEDCEAPFNWPLNI